MNTLIKTPNQLPNDIAVWITPTRNPDYVNKKFFYDCSICNHTVSDNSLFECPSCHSKTQPYKDVIERLFEAFPGCFINHLNEFIAHADANEYFRLEGCNCEMDVQKKVLAFLTRGAYKTEPFKSFSKNLEFHLFMLEGINSFLNTNFTEKEIDMIYTYMGNGVNYPLTETFIKSNFNMDVIFKYHLDKYARLLDKGVNN